MAPSSGKCPGSRFLVLVVVVDPPGFPPEGFDDEDDDPSAPLRAGYDDDCGLRGLP